MHYFFVVLATLSAAMIGHVSAEVTCARCPELIHDGKDLYEVVQENPESGLIFCGWVFLPP